MRVSEGQRERERERDLREREIDSPDERRKKRKMSVDLNGRYFLEVVREGGFLVQSVGQLVHLPDGKFIFGCTYKFECTVSRKSIRRGVWTCLSPGTCGGMNVKSTHDKNKCRESWKRNIPAQYPPHWGGHYFFGGRSPPRHPLPRLPPRPPLMSLDQSRRTHWRIGQGERSG